MAGLQGRGRRQRLAEKGSTVARLVTHTRVVVSHLFGTTGTAEMILKVNSKSIQRQQECGLAEFERLLKSRERGCQPTFSFIPAEPISRVINESYSCLIYQDLVACRGGAGALLGGRALDLLFERAGFRPGSVQRHLCLPQTYHSQRDSGMVYSRSIER